MTYKILHRIFGWDYIAWSNSADNGVARVEILPDGTVFYWRYTLTKVMDVVSRPEQVKWLTCHPSKYLGDKNNV